MWSTTIGGPHEDYLLGWFAFCIGRGGLGGGTTIFLMLSHSEQTLRSTTRQPLPERTATGFGLEGLFSESQLPRTRLFLGHALQHLQRLLPITRWGG